MKKLLFALTVLVVMSFSTLLLASVQDADGGSHGSVSVQHEHSIVCSHAATVDGVAVDSVGGVNDYYLDQIAMLDFEKGCEPLTGALEDYGLYRSAGTHMHLIKSNKRTNLAHTNMLDRHKHFTQKELKSGNLKWSILAQSHSLK
jgi:hypothetical protein